MTEHLTIGTTTLAYDLVGDGPLVVLAHGMGDSRHSYRFLVPGLVAAGYRVANVDVRGCGDSSLGWDGYSRTDIAGDLVALVHHLGGPAVVVGHSISGGAATIAAATAPDAVVGLVELAPFTRKQSVALGGLFTAPRYRKGMLRLARTGILGSAGAWTSYLDLAVPTKPADWDAELGRIVAMLGRPGRMKVLQKMGRSAPTDAGAQLAHVACPVLVIEGSLDPDWTDPRAEGDKILADLPDGLGRLAVIDGAGHYPHTETPDEVLALSLPFLATAFARAWAGLTPTSVTEAAAALADETGLEGLSMGLLAERLGIRTPSLYKHVGGQADLTHRIAVLAMTELGDALAHATQGLSGPDALAAAAQAMRAYIKQHPGRYAAGNAARPTGPDDPLRAAADRVLHSLSAALRGYGIAADQEVHAMRMLRSLLHGFATFEAAGGFMIDTPVDDSFDWMIRLLDQGLRGSTT